MSSNIEPPQETEAELERFRRQWQEEVSKKGKKSLSRPAQHGAPSSSAKTDRRKQPAPPSIASSAKPIIQEDGHDEPDPHAYHDLPDKEAEFRLDAADHGLVRGSSTNFEPTSALEHYEKAVERETQGSLGDSLKHYRKAFKLDDSVHEQYKNKHFPPSSFPPKRPAPPPTQKSTTQQKVAQTNPSNASATVPNPAHHSSQAGPPVPQSLTQLISDFSKLSIPGAPPPTDADPPPPCPIADLPEELLSDILKWCALLDLSSLSRISQVCKRFAYLAMTDEQVWRRIAQGSEYGFAGMNYDYVCDLKGQPLPDDYADIYSEDQNDDDIPPKTLTKTTPEIDTHLLKTVYRSSWRHLFRNRPRIRFNGCYISTVNYTRPGAASTDTRTWGTPIHIVTYFRYLRFFRDGTCISLLTTTEPGDVVHHLTKENLQSRQRAEEGTNPSVRARGPVINSGSTLPNSVMKDALAGRWRLSGPGDGSAETEAEGQVHVETEGVIPKYMWKMQFTLASGGRKDGARSNKLAWVGFWSYNRLTDDWGEFGLKNDKAFWFSRVRAYGMGI